MKIVEGVWFDARRRFRLTEKFCDCKEVHLRRNDVPVLAFFTDGLQKLTIDANHDVAVVDGLAPFEEVFELLHLPTGQIQDVVHAGLIQEVLVVLIEAQVEQLFEVLPLHFLRKLFTTMMRSLRDTYTKSPFRSGRK